MRSNLSIATTGAGPDREPDSTASCEQASHVRFSGSGASRPVTTLTTSLRLNVRGQKCRSARGLSVPLMATRPICRAWNTRSRNVRQSGWSGSPNSDRLSSRIVPGAGKEIPFQELVTHPFRLADIEAAYDLFSRRRDGVMKVAIRP